MDDSVPDRLSEPISATPGFDLGSSLSHTRRGTFLACQRKLALANGLGLRPAVASQPLRMGQSFGLCLEKQDHLAHMKQYGKLIDETFSDNRDYIVKEAFAVEVMARNYLNHYGPDEEREIYVEAPIPGTSMVDRGYVDFRNGDELGEDKFRNRWTFERQRLLQIDPQVTAYLNMAWRSGLTQNLEMEYRVTIRPYIRKKESVKDFRDFLEKQVGYDPGKWFFSMKVARTEQDLETFQKDLERLASQYEAVKEEGIFPHNFHSCQQYGLCEFFEICSRKGKIPEGLYVINREGRDNGEESRQGG